MTNCQAEWQGEVAEGKQMMKNRTVDGFIQRKAPGYMHTVNWQVSLANILGTYNFFIWYIHISCLLSRNLP